jgi:hypothetical protein
MVSKEFIERPGPGNYDSPSKESGPKVKIYLGYYYSIQWEGEASQGRN